MSRNNAVAAVIRRIYRMALHLYPHDFRVHFALQMCSAFELTLAGANERGLPEIAALLRGVLREWIAKLTTDPLVRGRSLPDWRSMRPAGMPKDVWFGGPVQSANYQTQCLRDTTR